MEGKSIPFDISVTGAHCLGQFPDGQFVETGERNGRGRSLPQPSRWNADAPDPGTLNQSAEYHR